jgi:hypothetical protein
MGDPRARTSTVAAGELRPPEPPLDPLEFLSRSWSASGRAFAPPPPTPPPAAHALAASPIAEDPSCEFDDGVAAAAAASGSSFSFASAATSQLIMERILAQSVRASTRPVPSSSIPIHLVFFSFVLLKTALTSFFFFFKKKKEKPNLLATPTPVRH